jgi:uncharacterized membrane protein
MGIINTYGKRDVVFVILTGLVSLGLFFIPSGFKSPYPEGSSVRTSAYVEEVDNSFVKILGPVKEGEQQLVIRIAKGKFKGRVFETTNILLGKLELDKFFNPGDKVFVVLDYNQERTDIAYANVIDHFRTNKTIILISLFFAFLMLIGGWIGLKAVLSFIFSGLLSSSSSFPPFSGAGIPSSQPSGSLPC